MNPEMAPSTATALTPEQDRRVEALQHATLILPSKLSVNTSAIDVAAALAYLAEWITEGPQSDTDEILQLNGDTAR